MWELGVPFCFTLFIYIDVIAEASSATSNEQPIIAQYEELSTSVSLMFEQPFSYRFTAPSLFFVTI